MKGINEGKNSMYKKKSVVYVIAFIGILILNILCFSKAINLLENHKVNATNKVTHTSTLKEKNIHTVESSDSNQIKNLDRAIAITFDDGPNEITTPEILNILKKKDVQATFFMLGENVIKNKEIVEQVFKNGHEIGNHSFSHRQLTLLSNEEMKAEIDKTDQAIFNITGHIPDYIRPPYGSANNELAEIGKRPFIEWSVDSKDWQSKNKESIINEVKNQVYPGSILLFHDIQPATVEALPEVIDYLYSQNYEFVTINQLLQSPKQVINYYGINDHRRIIE